MNKWTLPSRLKLDKQGLKLAEQQQKEWREKAASPFASLSPQEIERSRAAIMVRDLESALISLEEKPKKTPEELQTVLVIKRKLAEKYAVLGRFDRAAELHPHPAHKEEYVNVLKAIDRKDDEWCVCGNQGGSVAVSNTYVEREIWSIKHNRTIPVLRCRRCGGRNARTLTKEQAQMRQNRRRAVEIVADKTPAEAKEILINLGHTTAKLI